MVEMDEISNLSGSCDESIILEGPNADMSRITTIVTIQEITLVQHEEILERTSENGEIKVSLMPVCMDISLCRDKNSEQNLKKADKHKQTPTQLEEFQDANDEFETGTPLIKTKPNTQKIHRRKMLFRNGQQKQVEIPVKQVEETIETNENLSLKKDFQCKDQYLNEVQAEDCVKDKISGFYALQTTEIDPKPCKNTPKANHYALMKKKLKSKQGDVENETFKDCLAEWDESGDQEEDKLTTPISVPAHYKKYTVEERKIILKKPGRREMANQGVSYDGPEDAKKIDLANPGEDSKPVYIAIDLETDEEKELIEILQEFQDVFAWSYKDLKGVDPAMCHYTIPLRDDAKPSKQRLYSYNDNYAKKTEEEINRLKEAGFIYEIEHTEWVLPLVVVPKKNGKLRVCQS
ncbi:hypothetical protein L7F22_014185 [Adiantum nelumboides]|nr:hypothetical protein [Adiantum nelumboides]